MSQDPIGRALDRLFALGRAPREEVKPTVPEPGLAKLVESKRAGLLESVAADQRPLLRQDPSRIAHPFPRVIAFDVPSGTETLVEGSVGYGFAVQEMVPISYSTDGGSVQVRSTVPLHFEVESLTGEIVPLDVVPDIYIPFPSGFRKIQCVKQSGQDADSGSFYLTVLPTVEHAPGFGDRPLIADDFPVPSGGLGFSVDRILGKSQTLGALNPPVAATTTPYLAEGLAAVRVEVSVAVGQTITAGSVRMWTQTEPLGEWAKTNQTQTLATGSRIAAVFFDIKVPAHYLYFECDNVTASGGASLNTNIYGRL
jgi:hypothetical protein